MTIEHLKNSNRVSEAGVKKGAGSFAGNSATLAGGVMFAYAVSLIAAPITSRLFGPKEFGLAALFSSGAAILSVIACLRYEMALVLPKRDEDAASLLALCLMILVGMTALIAVLTVFFGGRILACLNAAELGPYLWLFPVYVFLLGIEFLLRFWNTRHKRFKLVAGGRILTALPTVAAEIGGGAAGFRTGGNLISLRVLALTIAPIFLLWRLLSEYGRAVARGFIFRNVLKGARRYAKFPLFDSFSTLLQVGSWHAPIILLPAFFSPFVGGLYTKAVYLLYLPTILIGESVGQTFFQLSAEKKAEQKDLSGLLEAVFNRTISIGVLPFAVVVLIGPELFGLALGDRWSDAGTYAMLISPWMFALLLSAPIKTLFAVLEKQDVSLKFNATLFLFRIGILILGGHILSDAYLTISLFSLASCIIILGQSHYLIRAVGLSLRSPLRHFMRCVAYAAPTLILVACMKWWLNLGAEYLLFGAAMLSVSYAILVLRYDRQLSELILKGNRKHLFYPGEKWN